MIEENVQASLVLISFSLKALNWKLVWSKLQLVSCHWSCPLTPSEISALAVHGLLNYNGFTFHCLHSVTFSNYLPQRIGADRNTHKEKVAHRTTSTLGLRITWVTDTEKQKRNSKHQRWCSRAGKAIGSLWCVHKNEGWTVQKESNMYLYNCTHFFLKGIGRQK